MQGKKTKQESRALFALSLGLRNKGEKIEGNDGQKKFSLHLHLCHIPSTYTNSLYFKSANAGALVAMNSFHVVSLSTKI